MRLMTSVVHATFVVLLLAHWGSTKENEICNRKSEACTDSNNDILSKVSLHVDYFQQGSKAVQVAYYATIAGGIELNELSIKVSRLALDMKRLHTKYIVMIVKHKAHFKSMLEKTEIFASLIRDDFHMQALKMLEFTEGDITKISQSAADLSHYLKAVIDQCFNLYGEAVRLMADNEKKQSTLDIERQEYEQRKSMNERLLESHRNKDYEKHAIDALQYAIQALLHVVRNMEGIDIYWRIQADEIETLCYGARNFQKLIMHVEKYDFKRVFSSEHVAQMMDENTHKLEEEIQKYARLEKQIEREHQSFEIGGNFVREHSQEEALIEVSKLTDELMGQDEDKGTRKVQHTEL